MISFRYKMIFMSLLCGIYIWPKAYGIPFGYLDWDYYSRLIFISYWLFILFFDLYGVRNLPKRFKLLHITVLLSFLIEGIGIETSLPGANTIFCWIPHPSTYNGIKIANLFSLIGSILINFNLVIIVVNILRNRESQEINGENEIVGYYLDKSYSILSLISIYFLFFHISFLSPKIFGSIGCNGMPGAHIKSIGSIWFITGILNGIAGYILKIKSKRAYLEKLKRSLQV